MRDSRDTSDADRSRAGLAGAGGRTDPRPAPALRTCSAAGTPSTAGHRTSAPCPDLRPGTWPTACRPAKYAPSFRIACHKLCRGPVISCTGADGPVLRGPGARRPRRRGGVGRGNPPERWDRSRRTEAGKGPADAGRFRTRSPVPAPARRGRPRTAPRPGRTHRAITGPEDSVKGASASWERSYPLPSTGFSEDVIKDGRRSGRRPYGILPPVLRQHGRIRESAHDGGGRQYTMCRIFFFYSTPLSPFRRAEWARLVRAVKAALVEV